VQLATLSAREKDVLQLLLLGKSSKEIAAELSINAKTVLKHRANILDKTGTSSVVELIRQLGPQE
jgi:DNA-binding CsgD family transcriptional regulator